MPPRAADRRSGRLTTPPPGRVLVVGSPGAPLLRMPSVSHSLDYVEAVDPAAGFTPQDVVVLRWDPAAPAGATLEDLVGRPAAQRPRVVVAGDVMEDALKGLIDQHGAIHIVGSRGPANAVDLAVTVDKLLSNDLFGMQRYFEDCVDVARYTCRAAGERDTVLDWVRAFADSHRVHRRIVDVVQVVADEMLTNALYNAPTDLAGNHPNANLSRTIKVALDGPRPVELELRCDGQRLGLSTVDPFGSLEPDTVISSLRRCFERATPRTGTGGAGLGLFLLLGSLSHVVFNVARGQRTEVIGLVDISGGFRHLRSSGKSFNMFVER